jgi:iron complex transport system substrate-binding protein
MRFPLRFSTLPVCLLLGITGIRAQISLVDDLQRPIVLSRPATRIVSLAPSITESLFAIGAGDQVVGVTDYCNYPPEARSRRHVGGMINPSIETIVGLDPDLILFSMEGNQRQDFTILTALRVPAFVTNPRNLDDINRSLLQLGILTGHRREAVALIDSLARRAALLKTQIGPVRTRTLLFVSVQPLVAVGARTFLNELLVAAGGDNLAASTGLTYPPMSREVVLRQDPAVLLIASDVLDSTQTIAALYPEWSRLSAVREKRVYRVSADLISRPGPRAVDGLASLIMYLQTGHP